MAEADRDEVRKFLRRFKRIAASTPISFVDRDKTDRTLLSLGLTRSNCKDEILNLSVLDYFSGPQPDHNRSGYLWVFGKTIGATEIYLKLKIAESGSSEVPICLSFHAAEAPLTYPFKDK